jgi:excisionase family DNA binding protein
MDERQYTVKEISDHFHVSRQAVYDWIKEGKLRAIKLGERVRVPDSALRAFIQDVKPGEPLPETE